MLVKSELLTWSEPFITEAGAQIAAPQMAYEQYGLAHGPVLLMAHGGLSSHHAAGRYRADDVQPGWWHDLIGPGKVFDTERYRIISSNALGSMFGSSSARTINPLTGCRYGPTFPAITMVDIASFLYQFLQQLGIERVEIMAGPSMGSLLTLQMAAQYPDFIGRAICVASAGRMSADGLAMHHFMRNCIQMDAEFRAGWYPPEAILPSMRVIAQAIKFYYLHENIIKKLCWDPVAEGPLAQLQRSDNINHFLQASSDVDVSNKDANCYLTLLQAINGFDLGRGQRSYAEGVRRIQCPLLLMNIDSDREFSPAWGQEVVELLNEHNNAAQATFALLHSDWGHLGCIKESEQISRHIRQFLGCSA